MEKSPYKAMYKFEIAAAAGVSTRTLRRWIRTDKEYFNSVGVSETTKLLPPIAVKYLCEKYVIEL